MIPIWSSLAVLQHHYPLPHPLAVRFEVLEDGVDGLWSFDEEIGHVILISLSVPLEKRDEVLVHEYAHALCHYWIGPEENSVWGLTYASLYLTILGEH